MCVCVCVCGGVGGGGASEGSAHTFRSSVLPNIHLPLIFSIYIFICMYTYIYIVLHTQGLAQLVRAWGM